MATSILKFHTYPGLTLTTKLEAQTGATGTPDAGGYTSDDSASEGTYLTEIDEDLIGEFEYKAFEPDGELAAAGYVVLENTTATFRGYDYNYHSARAASLVELVLSDVLLTRQMTSNKHTITPIDGDSVEIEVWNDAEDAIIRKLRYWSDGRREVLPLS